MEEEFEYLGQTGFQSACTEYAQDILSLDKLFGLRSENIYIMRASGGIGKHFHIRSGDLLILDRKMKTKPILECLYVVVRGSDFEICRYTKINGKAYLMPQKICIEDNNEFEVVIWSGIVAIINFYHKPGGIG